MKQSMCICVKSLLVCSIFVLLNLVEQSTADGELGNPEHPEFFDSMDLAVFPTNAKITRWFPFRVALAVFGLFVVPVGSLIFWLITAPVI